MRAASSNAASTSSFTALALAPGALKTGTPRFDISQPAVSQHLAALRNAGLVKERRDGRLVYYRVNPKGLKPLINWIAHYQAFWLERIDRLKALLEEME